MELLHPLRSKDGFTLTELMVVVAIAITMFGFGYSGFSEWQKKEVVRGAALQLSSHLKEARIAAMEKHITHSVVFSGSNYYVFKDPPPYGDHLSGNITSFNAWDLKETDSLGNTLIRKVEIKPGITVTPPTDSVVRFNVRGIKMGAAATSVDFANNRITNCKVNVSELGGVDVDCDIEKQ